MQAEHEKTLAALVLALAVVCALFFPELSSAFAPYLLPSLFFVIVFSLLPFARESVSNLTRPTPVVLAIVVWQQFILPAATLFVGLWIELDRQWLIFLLVTVTSGSLFASPTLVQLMGLQQKLAVQTVIMSTLAAPISIYVTFSILQEGHVPLDLVTFAFRLAIFLVVPLAILIAAKILTSTWSEASKDKLDGIGRWGSVLALVAFCFALEDEVTQAIAKTPDLVVDYFLVATAFAFAIGCVTRVVMTRFGVHTAVTATMLASFRNVGLTFGLVGQFAGPELAVYVGVCQIPMFFSPLLFELFVGKSRARTTKTDTTTGTIGEGKMVPEGQFGTSVPEPRAETGGFSRGMAPTYSYSVQPSQTSPNQLGYVQSGNVMVAVESETIADAAPAQALAEPLEVIASNPDVDFNADVEREDALALIRRLRGQLGEQHEKALQRDEEAGAIRASARHVGLFLSLCFMAVVVIWQANKYFSPMLFNQSLIERVAQAHVDGRNFAVFDLNINIRDLRDATIARLDRTPETVVLGASHWQEGHVALMPGKDFYNSHVHRDYYEDMLAVTEMWVRHDRLPKEMIIAVRDNLLTPIEHRTDFLWLPGIKYYRDFAARIGIEPHKAWETLPLDTWRQLVSLPLLFSQAKRRFSAPMPPHATDERNFDGLDTLLPGGSILWSGEHKRLFTQERARTEALAFAEAKRNDPPRIDPKGVAHLEALFEFLQAKGVKVTLVHPPFNPVFWDAVQDSPYMEGLNRVKALTRHWSATYGFPIIGGFAPDRVGCTADMYIDAEHSSPDCLAKIFQQYSALGLNRELRGAANN